MSDTPLGRFHIKRVKIGFLPSDSYGFIGTSSHGIVLTVYTLDVILWKMVPGFLYMFSNGGGGMFGGLSVL